jgi:hypothetical protein
MEHRREDEIDTHEQEAVEDIGTRVTVPELAEGLQALDAVAGDIDRLKRERPDLVHLLPYLQMASEFSELRDSAASDSAAAARKELIEQVMAWRASHKSSDSEQK